MSVEDIRSLVKQEKESEEQLKRAEEEAKRIVEEAKAEAESIVNDVECHRYLNRLREEETKKIEQKKSALEKESDEILRNLRTTANENMEKTVAFILRLILGE